MAAVAVAGLTGVAPAPVAGAQTAADIEVRDRLIADQEALLNVYRCRFDIDTHIVPGDCANGAPKLPAKAPDPFAGVASAGEIAVRDQLVVDQEALLNVYRCRFDIDTHVVAGGCREPDSPPTTPTDPGRAPTPAAEEQSAEEALAEILPWFTNPPDDARSNAVYPLREVYERDAEFGRELARAPWIDDGIVRWETDAMYGLGYLMDLDRTLARTILTYSSEEPVRSRNALLLKVLGELSWQNPESFEPLVSQPWFVDGLSPEERALIVALTKAPGSHSLYEDLLASHHTQSKSITLPLSGNVDLWAFQHRPFPPGREILAIMEQGVRGIERLVGAPLPVTDIIVMSVDSSEYGTDAGGVNLGDSVYIYLPQDQGVDRKLIYHELAHFYLGFETAPFWLVEGGANFAAEFVAAAFDSDNWDGRIPANEVQFTTCRENGIPNVHALSDPDPPDAGWQATCQYSLGQYFTTRLFNTVGEAAFSSALRELHLSYLNFRYWSPPPSEEEAFRIFRKHVPPNRAPAFLDLYRRLHGGPFVD